MKKMEDKIKERILKHVNEEEFNKKNAEFMETAKELGLSQDDIEKYILHRWNVYLSRIKGLLNNIPHISVKAVFFGLTKTDFGAKKNYDAAVELFNRDPELAVSQGITDSEGTPLYTTGFRKGKPINLDDFSYYLQAAIKKENGDWQITRVKVPYEKIDEIKPFMLYENIKIAEAKENVFSITKATVFSQPEKVSKNDIVELGEKLGIMADVKKAAEIARQEAENKKNGVEIDYNKFYIIKGDLLGNVLLTAEEKTFDVLRLIKSDDNLFIDDSGEATILTAWMDKNNNFITRRIVEDTVDVFVVGIPYVKTDEQGNENLFVNATGVWVDEKFVAPNAQPLTTDKITEVQKQQENLESSFE